MHVAILIREHTFEVCANARSPNVCRTCAFDARGAPCYHATRAMLRGGVLLQLCGQPALSSLATNKAAALCTFWNAVQQAASSVWPHCAVGAGFATAGGACGSVNGVVLVAVC